MNYYLVIEIFIQKLYGYNPSVKFTIICKYFFSELNIKNVKSINEYHILELKKDYIEFKNSWIFD